MAGLPPPGKPGWDGKSLAAHIRDRYSALSRAERQVADLLPASPRMMSGFTATELAGQAGVSKATITRFIGKLGLTDFDEFRRATRTTMADDESTAVGAPLQLMDEELLTTAGDLERLVAANLRSDATNLHQTFADLSLEDLAAAVDLLCTSEQVVFADFRKQYALAYYAATLFRVIRPNVVTLPIAGSSAVDGTLDLGASDVMVMFPFRRPERDQDILSKVAVAAGAKLIAVGDVWPNPTNQRAHIYFQCRTQGAGVFDSFVTPMSLINLLFTATANKLGVNARDRLALLEERHRDFQTFDPPLHNGRGRKRR